MISVEEAIRGQNVIDLNSKIFYKISFSISLNSGYNETDLLWEVILYIKKWLERKEKKFEIIHVPTNIKLWTAFKNGNKLFDANGSNNFYAESIKRVNPENENDVSWCCFIRECHNKEKGFAPRWWNTEIGFQTMGNGSARLSFVVSYGDAMGFIGECAPAPDMSVPGIVRNIQSDKRFECSVNDDPLLFDAIERNVSQGLALRDQIFDKERGIPIILIMPRKDMVDSEKICLPVNPRNMMRSVAGNALVYYSLDLQFVEEFNCVIDDRYKCTAGMIRYYLPNVDRNKPMDSNRHRYIRYDEALSMGEETILNIFRRVVAQDINDYDVIFRYRDCQELIRRDALQNRFNLLKKKQEENSKHIDAVQGDLTSRLEKMELENLELEIQKEDLESELSEAKTENYKLTSQIDSILAAFTPLQQRKDAFDTVRELSGLPNNPQEVMKFFTTVFSDRLAVTENGWKSLKECPTAPEILWGVLFTMVTTLYDKLELYNFSNFGEACARYNESSPYDCVIGNTGTTKKDKTISKEYEDYYNGEKICIEPHLRSNTGKESDTRFFRIYFSPYVNKSSGQRLIVIGSCGKHLTTAGSMHKK